MTEPEASITVAVDPTNPGQFFACCGLLELADRLWPGAEGWFAEGGREFRIACAGTLSELLASLVECRLTNTMTPSQHARLEELPALIVSLKQQIKEMGKAKENTLQLTALKKALDDLEVEKKALDKLRREEPIVLQGSQSLRIDWFTDDLSGGSRFKTWAGQQSVLDIATAMKTSLHSADWLNERCLTFSVAGCGLPFNFDSDLGGQGGAIDIGFSLDALAGSALTRIEPTACPAQELLAFIGLQRFRPKEIKGENRFQYATWDRPIPIQVAMPTACGALPLAGANQYEFRLLYRTKYLKSFLPAVLQTRGSDE